MDTKDNMAKVTVYRLQIEANRKVCIEEVIRGFESVLPLGECAGYAAGNGFYTCDLEFQAIWEQPVIELEKIMASLKVTNSLVIKAHCYQYGCYYTKVKVVFG